MKAKETTSLSLKESKDAIEEGNTFECTEKTINLLRQERLRLYC